MEIRRCLQLLELKECSTVDAAHSAYRDLVRVWHPDRFVGDPRLQKRAEERVKLLNTAYETLVQHLEQVEDAQIDDHTGTNESGKDRVSPTELFFEAGTRKVLTVWYSLRKAAQSALKEAAGKREDKSL